MKYLIEALELWEGKEAQAIRSLVFAREQKAKVLGELALHNIIPATFEPSVIRENDA